MTQADVKGCIYLMSQLWSNYRTPGTEMEINALVNTWLKFFGKAKSEDVTQAIMEISAEGGEFAPQLGQIYARVKQQKQGLIAGKQRSEEVARYCFLIAEMCNVDPPAENADNDELMMWFRDFKAKN